MAAFGAIMQFYDPLRSFPLWGFGDQVCNTLLNWAYALPLSNLLSWKIGFSPSHCLMHPRLSTGQGQVLGPERAAVPARGQGSAWAASNISVS